MGFANIVEHADIDREIPLATSKDKFKITIFDSKLDLVKYY
jgi:hypothetical protein